jgi:hypothetical protein
MNNYYNFQQSEYEISYEPYLYDRGDTLAYFIIAAILMIGGFVAQQFFSLQDATVIGSLLGLIPLSIGSYRLLLKNKIKLLFDKRDDALYKISPLGKKKLIAISNIYDITVWNEDMSFGYALTHKDKPGAKHIEITSFITKGRQKKEEVIFLEATIIPAVETMIFSNDTANPV